MLTCWSSYTYSSLILSKLSPDSFLYIAVNKADLIKDIWKVDGN